MDHHAVYSEECDESSTINIAVTEEYHYEYDIMSTR